MPLFPEMITRSDSGACVYVRCPKRVLLESLDAGGVAGAELTGEGSELAVFLGVVRKNKKLLTKASNTNPAAPPISKIWGCNHTFGVATGVSRIATGMSSGSCDEFCSFLENPAFFKGKLLFCGIAITYLALDKSISNR
jgi:hypothetical protein